MIKGFFRVLVIFFILFPCILWAQDEPAPEMAFEENDYIIGPGDILFISVWKDQALTQSIPVRPDGKISFPLIGEIMAGGLNVAQLQEAMEKKISRYVTDPVLTVGVQDIRSFFIYVIGRVNSPGRFAINSNINVLQALAMAGGCNTYANTKNIRIFRRSADETDILYFNYNDVSEGENLDQNIPLERGDVIVVP